MKLNSSVSKFLTNKWVLNIITILAVLNIIGYIVMGNLNNIMVFVILAVLVRYFSQNMIIVLGIPLIFVNLVSLKSPYYGKEGLENATKEESTKKSEDDHNKTNDKRDDSKVVSSNDKRQDEHFEVGRSKNGSSKIDYASTIEDAYDQLNQILGSDGVKRLTDDTQNLMKQQMDLAKSMEAMTPLIEGIMPMAQKFQGMMQQMDGGSNGLSSVMDMAKKMSTGLGTKV